MINNMSKISFGSVNAKYLKSAKEEYAIMNTVSGDLIESLQFDILTKKVNPQDGIDTVNELRKFTKQKYQKLLDSVVDICKIMEKRMKR